MPCFFALTFKFLLGLTVHTLIAASHKDTHVLGLPIVFQQDEPASQGLHSRSFAGRGNTEKFTSVVKTSRTTKTLYNASSEDDVAAVSGSFVNTAIKPRTWLKNRRVASVPHVGLDIKPSTEPRNPETDTGATSEDKSDLPDKAVPTNDVKDPSAKEKHHRAGLRKVGIPLPCDTCQSRSAPAATRRRRKSKRLRHFKKHVRKHPPVLGEFV